MTARAPAAEAEALAGRRRPPRSRPSRDEVDPIDERPLACRGTTTTSRQDAAISGAPPAPGRRVFGWS